MQSKAEIMKLAMKKKGQDQIESRGKRTSLEKEEARIKTSMYLPESLWISVGEQARREKVKVNTLVVEAVWKLMYERKSAEKA